MKPALVILAAGMGSRYGGLKQIDGMGPNQELMMDYSIYDALNAGFGKIVLVIRKDLQPLFEENILSRLPSQLPVEFAYQELDDLPEGFRLPENREKPWGTGHAVWCARNQIQEPFAVINADDFYGKDAFVQLAEYLNGAEVQGASFCMVGYSLKNTLSEHGSVSRGVCKEKKGKLHSVLEHTNISIQGSKIIADIGNSQKELDADTPVSLNCWGFTPAVFQFLERDLDEFLSTQIDQPKSEFFLPAVIDKAVQQQEAEVALLETTARWYGVTYPEDRGSVQKQLALAHQSGEYPEQLF